MSKYFHCTPCTLPSAFLGISFNDQGVCTHCQRYKGEDGASVLQQKYEKKFLKLLDDHKTSDRYDEIVACSGGKDSAYALNIFVNSYDLQVLALTFDNSFISHKAMAAYSQKKLGMA